MSTAPADNTLPRRVLPAIVVAFLFFAPQFAALEAPRNRYFLFWGPADTVSLCVAMLLLAACGLAIGSIVDRRGGPGLRALKDQVFAVLFLLAIGVNLPRFARAPFMLSFLQEYRDAALVLLKTLIALIAGGWLWFIVFRRQVLPRAARAACLILSPLAPIIVAQVFFLEGYAVRQDPLPAAPPAAATAAANPAVTGAAGVRQDGGTPILLIVFDEWSYERSTSGGEFLAELPSLRALRAESFFAPNALSPASTTYISVPRILFQTGEYRSLPGVIFSWRDFPRDLGFREEFITPSAEPGRTPPTIFAAPRGAGYATAVLGFYMPYRRIVGDQVDIVRTWSDYPRGEGTVTRLLQNVAQTPQYWRVPGVSTLWKKAYAHVFSRHWLALNARLLDDFETYVRTAPPRSMLFFHYPVPHAPFIYDGQGAYRGPFPIRSRMAEDIDIDVMRGTPEDYHQSLRHLDRVVGRIVETLREAGRYDDALLLMTSDHAWRNDPALTYSPDNPRVHHVPLLVKAPGQRSPRTVDGVVELNRIDPLLRAAAAGGLDEAAVARILEEIARPDGP